MKYDDGLGLRKKFNSNSIGANLIVGYTIGRMELSQRYPIIEPLLNRPKDFKLHIDSLMHEIYHEENYE